MLRTVKPVNLRKCMRVLLVEQRRYKAGYPFNLGVYFVPQQEAWVIERFGKYNTILEPGLNFAIPLVDQVKYIQSLKEMAIEVPEQHAITADNVTLIMDGVLYLKVRDPYKASYGVQDPEFAITQLAQTTMRSEIGKIHLDTVFKERDSLNVHIVDAINKASSAWGIDCLRYEIRDIKLPNRVQEAMQMQVEAERKKRAAVLESEGKREAEINVAEGLKRSRILNSEAFQREQVNQATGEAEALVWKAKAQATSVEVLAKAMTQQNGKNAVSMRIAEQYVAAFSNLAKKGNTVLLPTNTGDISSMVSQAMTIYNNLQSQHQGHLEEMVSSDSGEIMDSELMSSIDEEIRKVKDSEFKDIGDSKFKEGDRRKRRFPSKDENKPKSDSDIFE